MRKTKTVTITAGQATDEGGKPIPTKPGRDEGKVFLITEMSATDTEDWALQTFLALARSGVDVPDDVASAGLAGLAQFGLKGLTGISYAEAKPLLDKLMDCIQIKPDPKHPEVTRTLVESDIEEWSTRLFLRVEVFKLHVGFSLPGAHSISTSPTPAASASAAAPTYLPRSRK